jgi:transcription elongation factor Elf1
MQTTVAKPVLTTTLECQSCEQSFTYHTYDLKAGGVILCPHCQTNFICRSRELFTALKDISCIAR